MGKKVLVIGGAGYIGSHTIRYLQERGVECIVFDNFSNGHKEFVNCSYVEGDILHIEHVRSVFKVHDISSVIHFAAFIEAGESVHEPEKYFVNNVSGTLNVLKVMREFGVKDLVFSSTAAVYGDCEDLVLSEDSEIGPINAYGKSKLMVEEILKEYVRAYGFNCTVLRYFNASGAGYDVGEWHSPETHLIPLVLFTALGLRESISIFGENYDTPDGTCVRDYVHVLDLAQAHHLALKHVNGFNVYNVGSERGYSVKEIIELCKKISGVNFKVIVSDRRKGDPARLVASSQKISNELGFKITYSIEDIISSAYKWHKRK
ncbi:MAG: UDP-glucose 4-epimerase GalE [Nanoarchaeota archaeon]|nr:UDP-glucose 4-epimerase GalE [Nanoarchaeota archaeon]